MATAERAPWDDRGRTVDTSATALVTLADIESARKLLTDIIRVTPLEPSRPLSAMLGGPTWLKCEQLQRAGSFKIRGAYVRMSRLSEEERARGVVAASAGNHAQGVALARTDRQRATSSRRWGPLPKVAATKDRGKTVEFSGKR